MYQLSMPRPQYITSRTGSLRPMHPPFVPPNRHRHSLPRPTWQNPLLHPPLAPNQPVSPDIGRFEQDSRSGCWRSILPYNNFLKPKLAGRPVLFKSPFQSGRCSCDFCKCHSMMPGGVCYGLQYEPGKDKHKSLTGALIFLYFARIASAIGWYLHIKK